MRRHVAGQENAVTTWIVLGIVGLLILGLVIYIIIAFSGGGGASSSGGRTGPVASTPSEDEVDHLLMRARYVEEEQTVYMIIQTLGGSELPTERTNEIMNDQASQLATLRGYQEVVRPPFRTQDAYDNWRQASGRVKFIFKRSGDPTYGGYRQNTVQLGAE